MMPDKVLRITSTYQAAVTVALAGAAWALWNGQMAASVCAGGALMGLNFWLLRILMNRLMAQGTMRAGVAVLLAMKLVMMGGIAAIVFSKWPLHIDKAGFALGMVSLMVGIVLATTLHGGERGVV